MTMILHIKRGRIVYEKAEDIKSMVIDIAYRLRDTFPHIDCSKIHVIRSKGSRSRAIARIHGLPRIWQYALGIPPQYIIEVVSENFDRLNLEEKLYVLIHELLHIPKSFSGGLRPHRGYVTDSTVKRLLQRYIVSKSLG